MVYKKLKTVESDDLGEQIGRAAQIQFFQEQIKGAQIWLAAVPKYRIENWLLERKFCDHEREDNIDRAAKTDKACENRYKEEVAAKERLNLAKWGIEAAQSNDFDKTIEQATLIKAAHEEV